MSRLIRTIGLGAGCILLPILTCAQPDPAALLYWQPFDAGPGLPTAWSVSSTGTQASAQAESPGSGHLNVLFEGDTAGWLVSPTLDFREAQLDSLHLLVRRSSTFAADGFRIVASVDNGATFSIPLAGSDWLPERANSWTPKTLAIPSTVAGHQVRIAISTDGQSAGVLRIDDFQLTGTGHIPSTTFGFAATQDSLAAGGLPWKIQTRLKNDSAHPATALSFDLAGAEPMQLEASSPDGGWQFDVAWVDDRWQIVATSNRGIEPAEELQIDLLLTPTGPSDHVYELEVGRILVAGGADGNQDLDAVPGLSATTLLIEEGTASIALDPEYVAFGYVRSGAPVERTFRVFNPSGTAPLMVELAPSHEAVSVSKSEFAVAPGSAELVSVGLNPAPLPLGAFMEEIKAEHTAPGEALTIPVLGSVIAHPLGDADESGGFDTVDLVRMIDYVLGVLTASETAFPSVDLFPFGRPDSQIDVRDLSVLARALVNQHWPDDSAIEPTFHPFAKQSQQVGGVHVSGDRLILRTTHPVRAVLIAWAGGDLATFDGSDGRWATLHNGERSLAYHLGEGVPAGTYSFSVQTSGAQPVSALAVLNDESVAQLGIHRTQARPVQPHPNPYVLSRHDVVQTHPSWAGAEVTDMLGRHVGLLDKSGQWRPSVSPGVYVIRTLDGQTGRLTVLR